MARFRATIQGQRGSASRLGSAKSGIMARVNGWDVGVEVVAQHNASHSDSRDIFELYATGGSHNAHRARYIGYVTLVNNTPMFVGASDSRGPAAS